MILARTPEGTPPARLRHVWFAQSLGRDHHREFSELVGTLPRQVYGMTETTTVVTADRGDPPSHELIGEPVPGRRVRLVDPSTHADVEPGTPGMIIVAGERGVDLFAEYLDDPAVTDRTFTTDGDGVTWLLTGDLAVQVDSPSAGSGALRFVGRADDVIKVAGENVSLTEVEAVLAQAPGVLEVAVVARADAIRDQVPVAYVVARDPDHAPTVDELADVGRRSAHAAGPAARVAPHRQPPPHQRRQGAPLQDRHRRRLSGESADAGRLLLSRRDHWV